MSINPEQAKGRWRENSKKSLCGQRKRQSGQIQETSPIINGLESNLRLGTYTIKPLQVIGRSRGIVNNSHIQWWLVDVVASFTMV